MVLESWDSVLGYVSQDRIAVDGRLARAPQMGLRDGMGLIAAQVTSVCIPTSSNVASWPHLDAKGFGQGSTEHMDSWLLCHRPALSPLLHLAHTAPLW